MAKARRRPSVTANAKEAFQFQSDKEPNSNTRTPKTRFTKLSSLSLKSVNSNLFLNFSLISFSIYICLYLLLINPLLVQVLLYDWWLINSEDKGLAVGGIASRGSLGVRAFCSTAITKRHDTTTLETADGIRITISGLINRSRTHLNGFPLEVCNHFRLGFPYYWEEYAKQFCGQEYANGGVPSRVSCFDEVNMSSSSDTNTLQPVSLDDIPVTKISDILMFHGGDSENSVLHREILNVLGKFCSTSVQDENPSNQDKIGAAQQSRAVKRPKKYNLRDQTKKGAGILTPSRGVVTRSMARLRDLANEHKGNFSSIKH